MPLPTVLGQTPGTEEYPGAPSDGWHFGAVEHWRQVASLQEPELAQSSLDLAWRWGRYSGPRATVSQRRLTYGLAEPCCSLQALAQSSSLVLCLPFQVDIAFSPLLHQDRGEECDCGLCHSCHHKARASEGQKLRFLFLPALRRQHHGKEGEEPVPSAFFLLAA